MLWMLWMLRMLQMLRMLLMLLVQLELRRAGGGGAMVHVRLHTHLQLRRYHLRR